MESKNLPLSTVFFSGSKQLQHGLSDNESCLGKRQEVLNYDNFQIESQSQADHEFNFMFREASREASEHNTALVDGRNSSQSFTNSFTDDCSSSNNSSDDEVESTDDCEVKITQVIKEKAIEYSQVLLRLLDGAPVDKLVEGTSLSLDISLKNFLTSAVESATRPAKKILIPQGCDDATWAGLLSTRIAGLNSKRLDRLL